MSDALLHYTNEFRSRRDVSPYDAEVFFEALIGERDEDLVTDLLTAWNGKGITEDELYRFASIMRSRMTPLETNGRECVDIVGTGGSKAKTFNVSTAAAFVVAGAGIPVAKHGNRAATSRSGSADVLSHLGINVDVPPANAEETLDRDGICFMFAPRHHSLSKTLAAARKRVPGPTIFNCIGPLCNPAGAQYQLLGVWDERLLNSVSRVLHRFGTKRSWVVNNGGTLDEIGLAGKTKVVEVADGSMRGIELTAEDFGMDAQLETPKITDPKTGASLIEALLKNEMRDSGSEQLLLMNAAAAISLFQTTDLTQSVEEARSSLRNGRAQEKLEAMRRK